VNGVVIGVSIVHILIMAWATVVGPRNGRPARRRPPTPCRRALAQVRASFLRFLNFALA
jgi:hypothetical protein